MTTTTRPRPRPITKTAPIGLPKFDIYATSPLSKRVLMNGVVLDGVQAVEVSMEVGKPSTVTITFVAQSINEGTAAIMELFKKEST